MEDDAPGRVRADVFDFLGAMGPMQIDGKMARLDLSVAVDLVVFVGIPPDRNRAADPALA